MSKRWQWTLLLIYGAAVAVLFWQRAFISMQLLIGAVFIGQGSWALWRHYMRREIDSPARVGWAGWGNLAVGTLSVGLTLSSWTAEQHIATEPKIWCGGREWRGYGRPPDECGLDALRPMPLGQAGGPQGRP